MKRIENKKLLASYRSRPCAVCGTRYSVNAHHIITRARQGPDEEWNLLPLCFKHHREIHDKPIREFFSNHPHVFEALEEYGWQWLNEYKIYNPSMEGEDEQRKIKRRDF